MLQAISKRVHYGASPSPLSPRIYSSTHPRTGKFVSESKFSQDPAAFIPHIRSGDTAALDALITKPEVERRLLERLRKKAELYAQDLASDGEIKPSKGKLDVDGVVDLYESYIIPLTKEVEVRVVSPAPLFRRSGGRCGTPRSCAPRRLIICCSGWTASRPKR